MTSKQSPLIMQTPSKSDEEKMLQRFGGRRRLLMNVVGVFLESYPETLAAIRKAVIQRDGPGLEEAAHRLKGAVCNLLKEDAYETAKKLEYIGRDAKWDVADATLAALELEMKRLRQTLEDMDRSDLTT